MITFLGIFLFFLLLGVPISLALGVGGMLFLWVTDNWMLVQGLPQKMLAGVDQFILLTIPLFLPSVVTRWDRDPFTLASINPDYPPRIVPRREIEWMARILWVSQ